MQGVSVWTNKYEKIIFSFRCSCLSNCSERAQNGDMTKREAYSFEHIRISQRHRIFWPERLSSMWAEIDPFSHRAPKKTTPELNEWFKKNVWRHTAFHTAKLFGIPMLTLWTADECKRPLSEIMHSEIAPCLQVAHKPTFPERFTIKLEHNYLAQFYIRNLFETVLNNQ